MTFGEIIGFGLMWMFLLGVISKIPSALQKASDRKRFLAHYAKYNGKPYARNETPQQKQVNEYARQKAHYCVCGENRIHH